MNTFLKITAALGLTALAVAGCSRPSLNDESLSTRDFNLEEYFAGNSVAYGQFQDRFGKVRQRFVVDLEGEWDGTTLTLTEDFTYDDGRTEQRIWKLKKTGDDTWEGTAAGVQGLAKGEENGDTFNWAYTIDLPLANGKTQRVSFDDWMWLLPDGRVLNKAYMSRFGVTLGEVTIFFEQR
jgi:hypothetical protein